MSKATAFNEKGLEHEAQEDGTFLYRYRGEKRFKPYGELEGTPLFKRHPRDPQGSFLTTTGPKTGMAEAARVLFGEDAMVATSDEEKKRCREKGYVKVGAVRKIEPRRESHPVFVDPSETCASET